MKARRLILLGLMLALLSCHPSARRSMTRADALLPERPDSALAVLQKLSKRRLTAKERARYALLTTIAQDKCYSNTQDDSLASFAYRYYSLHGDKRNLMKASYYLGCIYQRTDELVEATVLFKEAEELALTLHETRFLAYTKLRLAEVCAKNYDNRRALSYAENSIPLFREAGETYAADYAQTTAARQLFALQRYSEALALVDSLLTVQSVDKSVRFYALLLKADISFVQKAYHEAKVSYRSAHDLYPSSIKVIGHLAAIEEMEGHSGKADSLIEQAKLFARSEVDSAYVLTSMQQIHFHRNNYREAYEAIVKTTQIQDRAVIEMLERSVTNAEKTYYEEAYLLKRAERQILVLLFSVIVLFLFIIIAVISLALKRRKTQVVQEMEKVEGLVADLQKAIEMQKGAGLVMSAMMKDKVAQMQGLSNSFFSWSEEAFNDREKRNGSLSKDSLVAQFRKELQALREDKNLFSLLEDALNAAHNNVMANLKERFSKDSERTLKELDYQVLTLLFSGFTPKSISFVMDLSEETVRTRKSRYKKMFLSKGEAGAEFIRLLS